MKKKDVVIGAGVPQGRGDLSGVNQQPEEGELTMTTKTLKEGCAEYVAHMKEKGQKPSTLGTIERTLALLQAEMGESKEVGKILPVHVDKFYKSDAATMQKGKDGLKPRAKPSVDQIRRIVRMALVWFHEQGWLDKVPVPGEERKFVEKREARQAKREEKEAKPKAKKERPKKERPKKERKAKASVPRDDSYQQPTENEPVQAEPDMSSKGVLYPEAAVLVERE